VNACFSCVRFSFPCQAKILVWGTSPRRPILCRVGRETITQSIKLENVENGCKGGNGGSVVVVCQETTLEKLQMISQCVGTMCPCLLMHVD